MTSRILEDVCELIVDSEHKTAPKDPEGLHPLIRTTDFGQAMVGYRARSLLLGQRNFWRFRSEDEFAAQKAKLLG